MLLWHEQQLHLFLFYLFFTLLINQKMRQWTNLLGSNLSRRWNYKDLEWFVHELMITLYLYDMLIFLSLQQPEVLLFLKNKGKMLISRAILSSTAMAIIAKPLLANGACVTPLINEFKPNPTGADPPNTRVEILCADSDKGAGSDFSGWLVSIESDPGSSNPGDINDFAQISGAFDANGLFVATIPDLENPSFTLVLMDSFTGDSSTDIDLDNDGTPDDLSTFGLVFDAIGILDTIGDPVYGVELGGTDIAYTGDEPRLVFRDGTDPSMLFAINDPDNDQVIAADGSVLEPSIFDTNPLLDTFGSINPSLSSIEGPSPAPVPAVFIHDIQGSGYESPLNGEIVTVEAVVVGDFQENDADESRNLRGFFLQEEDADADDDLSTSEGIFVFDGSNPTVDVSIGDLVRTCRLYITDSWSLELWWQISYPSVAVCIVILIGSSHRNSGRVLWRNTNYRRD